MKETKAPKVGAPQLKPGLKLEILVLEGPELKGPREALPEVSLGAINHMHLQGPTCICSFFTQMEPQNDDSLLMSVSQWGGASVS